VKTRVSNIFNQINKKPDTILIKNATTPYIDTTFFYVTGLQQGIFEESLAILHPNGEIDLLVSTLEAESAAHANATLHIYHDKTDYHHLLQHLIPPYTTLGLNYKHLSHSDFTSLKKIFPTQKTMDISHEITRARLIKDNDEITAIKHACHITDSVMEKIPSLLHDTITESELAAEIDYLMQKHGATKPAFETISSFGPNTAEPHYSHGTTRLEQHDFIICDFGATASRYNADLTRTLIKGPPQKQHQEMHDTVRNAQQIAFDHIKPGTPALDVHTAVSTYIDHTQFKGRFIHSTGHSLGLDVHDGPGFTQDNTMLLKENMILTVEPGIYLPGIGGVRIEDDIRVTKNGYELLTTSPRELITV
jgi:Xaa-Pro dipeptidase